MDGGLGALDFRTSHIVSLRYLGHLVKGEVYTALNNERSFVIGQKSGSAVLVQFLFQGDRKVDLSLIHI